MSLQAFFASLPDLRNGNAGDYELVHVASGIPSQYYMIDSSTCPVQTSTIRTRVRLIAAHYASRIQAEGAAAADARAQGACLACVREGMNHSWSIAGADLVASQTVAITDWAWDPSLTGDARVTDQGIRAHYVAYDDDYMPDDVIAKLMRIGLGMLPCTGVVLVKTDFQHHFVDPHKVVHRTVLNQVLGRPHTPPFNLDVETFEDVVCHKAAHCVVSSVAAAIARNPNTRVRLMAAQLGSAAVRVPALYGPEAAAGAMLKVARMASSLGAIANVAVDITAVESAAAAVSAHRMETPEGRTAAAESQAKLVETFGEDIAFCAGLVQQSFQHAGQAGAPILQAWSVKNVMNNCSTSVTRGVVQMEQAFSVQRSQARRGIVPGVGLFGAEAPPSTDPLPADETLAQILQAVLGGRVGEQVP